MYENDGDFVEPDDSLEWFNGLEGGDPDDNDKTYNKIDQ